MCVIVLLFLCFLEGATRTEKLRSSDVPQASLGPGTPPELGLAVPCCLEDLVLRTSLIFESCISCDSVFRC